MLGAAYTLGVRTGLTSADVHAIWDGKAPQLRFRPRQYDMNNNYIWQRATFSRPGNCLDLTPDKTTGRPTPPAMCRERDRTKRSGDQLHFTVENDGAIRISVSDKPATDGKRTTDGALFEVEGQIGIGPTFDDAAKFPIRLDATGLFVPGTDEKPNPDIQSDDDRECCAPVLQRVTSPLPLWLLPATKARLCEITGSKDKKLLLVQLQSGLLQGAPWSDRLQCRALLRAFIATPPAGHYAGCLGAPWNGFDQTDLALSLFEITGGGDFASLQ